jgi:hypothetical protein
MGFLRYSKEKKKQDSASKTTTVISFQIRIYLQFMNIYRSIQALLLFSTIRTVANWYNEPVWRSIVSHFWSWYDISSINVVPYIELQILK